MGKWIDRALGLNTADGDKQPKAAADIPVPFPSMSLDQTEIIWKWLAFIGETDPKEINHVMTQCRSDPDARAYFLGRSKEVTNDNNRTHTEKNLP